MWLGCRENKSKFITYSLIFIGCILYIQYPKWLVVWKVDYAIRTCACLGEFGGNTNTTAQILLSTVSKHQPLLHYTMIIAQTARRLHNDTMSCECVCHGGIYDIGNFVISGTDYCHLMMGLLITCYWLDLICYTQFMGSFAIAYHLWFGLSYMIIQQHWKVCIKWHRSLSVITQNEKKQHIITTDRRCWCWAAHSNEL